MEPQSGPFDVPGSTEGGPTISRLTRRHFLAMAGAAAGVAGIAVVLKRLTSASSRQQTSAKVRLPDMPSPNPAYRGWVTADGGLLLSTRMQHDKFLAFRLNANGRGVWQLCDGTRTPEEIAAAFGKQTGRQDTEATEFLAAMMKLGVIVVGSHIVLSGEFPRPPAGGCYHSRTSPRVHHEA